jgi:predicted nucleic acid-binding protein
MKVVDSSVAIAALVEASERHKEARAAVAAKPSIPLHAALETFSVATRMPEPYRIDPISAAELLTDSFADRVLPGIAPRQLLVWLRRLAAAGIGGGAIYDAAIAESARLAGATLITTDRRAAATYRAVGVDVQMLGD